METVVSGYVGSTVLANGTTATTQSANDNSTKVATTAYADAAGNTGGFVQIGRTVATGSSGTVTFSSIPQTYADLKITVEARDTKASTSELVRLKINNDGTAGNYTTGVYLLGNGTAASSGSLGAPSANGFGVFSIPAANATAEYFTVAELTLINYTRAGYHKMFSRHNQDTTDNIVFATGVYKVAAAITELSLITDGTAFATGSAITLYGLGSSA